MQFEKPTKELRSRLYKKDGAKCFYCEIPEKDVVRIWGRFYNLKSRGKKLEIDRKSHDKKYYEKNCILSCSLCNIFRSDKLSCKEFKGLGAIIKEIWKNRKEALKKLRISAKEKEKIRELLYKKQEKKCYYCGIAEVELRTILSGTFYGGTARGQHLELSRKNQEEAWSENNCILLCPVCSNGKSNKFTHREFKKMGNALKKIWEKRRNSEKRRRK